jgi:RNA polymerase sigma factor (sigma-70 family)
MQARNSNGWEIAMIAIRHLLQEWSNSFLATRQQPLPRGEQFQPPAIQPLKTETTDDFEAFFQRHCATIVGYIFRMMGDEQGASDLCQETFIRAWQHFESLRTYDRPVIWLIRTATHLTLHELRRRASPVAAASILDDDLTDDHGDFTAQVAERDLVHATLLAIPPRPRAMLILREVYGLSCDEIAPLFGVLREAVKVALWRARRRFQEAYLAKGGHLP